MNLQSLIFNQPDYYSPSYFPEKKRQGFIDVNNLYVTCDWFWVGLDYVTVLTGIIVLY